MLTVRMLTSDYQWKWVNIVMHIRQSFICDDSEPSIVCINQVIDEIEATHFKTQSQLYSSHIARSPEFLAAASKDARCLQTISQVTKETGEQYPSSLPYSASSPLYYPTTAAEYGVVTTVPNQAGLNLTTKASLGSVSDGSCESSPGDEWSGTKEQLQQLLKRKMSRSAGQHCSKKRVRHNATISPSNSSPSLSQQSHFLTNMTSLNSVGGFGLQSMHAGDSTMMMQAADTPVYAQLKGIDFKVKNADVMMVNPVSPHSPGPLTPDSMMSDGGVTSHHHGSMRSHHQHHTSLSVDVSDVAVVPRSVLTPDASPMNSPLHVSHASPAAQCVPSIIGELEQALKLEEFKQQQQRSKSYKMKPVLNLPVLDSGSVDSYFGTLESPVKDINMPELVAIKQEVLEDMEFGDDDMKALLQDGQIANLMSSVADTILNMADASPGQSDVFDVDDMVGDVKEEVGGAYAAENLSMTYPGLMQQLDQMTAAGSSPSYGESHVDFKFVLPHKNTLFVYSPAQKYGSVV